MNNNPKNPNNPSINNVWNGESDLPCERPTIMLNIRIPRIAKQIIAPLCFILFPPFCIYY